MSVDNLETVREHDATPIPLPDDHHSAYAHQGDLIRMQIGLGWERITVGTTELLRHSDREITGVKPPELKTYNLIVGLCYGLAPYVGRPFHYEWHYAIDEHNRWVGGPDRIVYNEGTGS